jgi:hypothetical protein
MIKDTIRKYDRSFVAIATAVGLLITAYLSVGNKVDDLVSNCQTVRKIESRIELNEKLQMQTNSFMNEKFGEINRKLDLLVRR